MPTRTCACKAPVRPRNRHCADCCSTRRWARRMAADGGAKLRGLERWAEAAARDGRRSWQCACGRPVEARRIELQQCPRCAALRGWCRMLTTGAGRRLRSLERWAERVARDGRRSWQCACGAELPDPLKCRHCADCAKLRYWARRQPTLRRLEARRLLGRETGDWICSACGAFQGPVDNVACTDCGCDVTTGEPGVGTRRPLHVPAEPEHLGDGAAVVWNGTHGTSLLNEGPHRSSLAWILESASHYRVHPEMWR